MTTTPPRLTPQRRAEIEATWQRCQSGPLFAPDWLSASHMHGYVAELLDVVSTLERDLTAERAARERAERCDRDHCDELMTLKARFATELLSRKQVERERERLVGMLLVRADCYEDELPENVGENSWGACRNIEYMHGDWEWHASRAEARAALFREDAKAAGLAPPAAAGEGD